jgi:poly(beta-D-mannuronate) lyase
MAGSDSGKEMKKSTAAVILYFIAVSFLSAKIIPVATADDIKRAAKAAVPGDTLLMKNGVWRDEKIVLEVNGTVSLPVVLKAETPGSVILNGTSQLRISGSSIVIDGLWFKEGGFAEKGKAVIEFRTSSTKEAADSRLTNCAITGYNPADKFLDYKWVSLYGKNNRVDHCTFTGKNHQGTLLVVWLDSLPGNHRIDHNYFGPRPVHGENGAEIIRIGTSDWSMFSSKTTVEENYFYSCDGEVEIISNKSCDNVYRYNTFVECAGSLTLRHANRAQVYGNYFFGNHKKNTGGVRVIGEDHLVYNNYFDGLEGDKQYSALSFMLGTADSKLNGYFQVKNARILFNTFVDNRNNIVIGVTGSDPSSSLPPLNSIIANNLIVKNRGTVLREIVPPQSMLYEGNLVDVPSSSVPASFRIAAVAMTQGADKVWRLDPASSAVGAAVGSYSEIAADLDGQSRDKKPDVGADEYSKDQQFRRPLQKSDVGAGWQKN